jgi:hypothetical protein
MNALKKQSLASRSGRRDVEPSRADVSGAFALVAASQRLAGQGRCVRRLRGSGCTLRPKLEGQKDHV